MPPPPKSAKLGELPPDDWRLLIEGVQDYAIFMLDLEGRVVTWNRGAELIKGYQAAEIIGRHFSAFYPEDELAAGTPTRELKVASEVGRLEEEGWRLRKDGTRFWASVVITALRDDTGTLRGFTKVTRDLTARRGADEELRRSEERFRLLMEAVSDYAIYMLDPTGRVTTWNVGAEKIKGYSAAEIIGRNFSEFFPESDARAGKPQLELEEARTKGRFEEEGYRIRKDGSQFWASVVVTPIRDARGELQGFAKVTRDLTSRLEAERNARRLVAEQAAREAAEAAKETLRESEERFRSLSTRLEVILEGLADGVAVQGPLGEIIFVNSAGARAMGFPSVEACLRATPMERAQRYDLYDEHGLPVVTDELPGRRVLRGEPACSMLVHVRDRDTGEDWWRLLKATATKDAAGRPELAIYIWHDVTESRRRQQHEAYLARASAALAESLDYGSTLTTLASLLVPGLGDWCTIHLLEDGQLQSVAVSHVDPEKVKFAREVGRRYPPDPSKPIGVWNVLRTGRSELHAHIPDALLAQSAQDEQHLQILREVGLQSVLIVPIRMRERVLGTLSLVSSRRGHRYTEHDLRLAEELGRRAGSSIDNARLYAGQKKARQDLALLAAAGESFATAASYDEVLQRVVQTVLPVLGDFAFFDVVVAEGVRRIAAAHEDPETDALVKSTSWMRSPCEDKNVCALSSGRTGYEPQIDDAWRQSVATSPEHLTLLRRLQLASLVTVPLRMQGQLLGALTVCYGSTGRHHTDDDVKLVEELARRGAISMAQAQLYERAQEAAARAEEANRMKDEFLATVSHELRTPLNAILGWSSLLRARSVEPASAKPLEIIHRNALAQGKIIEDILDASRIITGKLRLDLKLTSLNTVVQDAVEILRPSMAAKNIAVALDFPQHPVRLMADPERLQQVAWNVLSNAVKFSNNAGTITITLANAGDYVVLTVADTGKGIAPDFLPFVFDRFKQADGSTTRRVGGLGLGLAIVRNLVELHGGHVDASSPGLGQGATFRVTLPTKASASDATTADADTSETGRPTPVAAAGALEGMRLLVVDDEADARELLATVLSEVGAVVETAASAAEALAALQRLRPDLIVSDIGMPVEDGYSLMRQVRALRAEDGGDTKAIALTAYTREQDRERALGVGFERHIAKPVDTDLLIAAILELAATRRGAASG